MSELVFAATQMACDWNKDGNLDRAEQAVREAADLGAQIILLQELFETPYFCKDEEEEHDGCSKRAPWKAPGYWHHTPGVRILSVWELS